MNKKKLLFIGIVLLVVIIGLIIMLIVKPNKNNKKTNEDTLVFEYYINEKVSQRVTFIYEKKKLSDITLTLFFESKDIAKGLYKAYKEAKEFRDYKLDGKKVILYYDKADIKDYKSLTREDIIREFTDMGYEYKK